jgi:hypothetical protein
MAKSREMQQALDIVAGRKPTPAARSAMGGLERIGVLLWIGVGLMVIGLAALYFLG